MCVFESAQRKRRKRITTKTGTSSQPPHDRARSNAVHRVKLNGMRKCVNKSERDKGGIHMNILRYLVRTEHQFSLCFMNCCWNITVNLRAVLSSSMRLTNTRWTNFCRPFWPVFEQCWLQRARACNDRMHSVCANGNDWAYSFAHLGEMGRLAANGIDLRRVRASERTTNMSSISISHWFVVQNHTKLHVHQIDSAHLIKINDALITKKMRMAIMTSRDERKTGRMLFFRSAERFCTEAGLTELFLVFFCFCLFVVLYCFHNFNIVHSSNGIDPKHFIYTHKIHELLHIKCCVGYIHCPLRLNNWFATHVALLFCLVPATASILSMRWMIKIVHATSQMQFLQQNSLNYLCGFWNENR